ncbi:hypothetical protein OJAG_22040 [Oerskovia enterophila]|uniref:Uncharacterized protein n=1 Tax=Oerskovia enterophila TaxID=43678 RepID=A0A163RBJ3_9CELL|nr:hypothetical protein OJAG_22040 [Oerskovia enterophila]
MVRVTLPSEGLSPRSDRHAHAQCGLVGPSRVTARTGLAGRSDRPHTRDRPGTGNRGPPTRASPASMRRDGAPTRFQIRGRSHRRNTPICPATTSGRPCTTGHGPRPAVSRSMEPRPALSPATARSDDAHRLVGRLDVRRRSLAARPSTSGPPASAREDDGVAAHPRRRGQARPARRPGTTKGPGTLRYPGPSVNPPRLPEREAQELPGWIRWSEDHLMIFVTRPEPTVRPPSRMAKPRPSSMAIGWISATVISVLSPGMTISVPSGSVMTPVTSVVRK